MSYPAETIIPAESFTETSPAATFVASTAAVANDVRYVTLPVRAGAGAVASAAACAALLDEASMCTV